MASRLRLNIFTNCSFNEPRLSGCDSLYLGQSWKRPEVKFEIIQEGEEDCSQNIHIPKTSLSKHASSPWIKSTHTFTKTLPELRSWEHISLLYYWTILSLFWPALRSSSIQILSKAVFIQFRDTSSNLKIPGSSIQWMCVSCLSCAKSTCRSVLMDLLSGCSGFRWNFIY